jgi:hypothetical protein
MTSAAISAPVKSAAAASCAMTGLWNEAIAKIITTIDNLRIEGFPLPITKTPGRNS